MSAPQVSKLKAPARLSKPSGFVNEATVFLETLPVYRTQTNELSAYINSKIPNKWNMGKLHGVRNFPSISQTTIIEQEYLGDSISYTSYIDTVYFRLQQQSIEVNLAGAWFDQVIGEVGLMPYDINKPMVSGITLPMRRDQAREEFNNRAVLFTATAIDNINSLYQAIYHTYISCCSDFYCGSITDSNILNSYDMGSITDSNL